MTNIGTEFAKLITFNVVLPTTAISVVAATSIQAMGFVLRRIVNGKR